MLKACVDSIQALPFEKDEAEIIVVDDGSSPPPASPRGVRLIRQEQAGLSVARNTGISHAQGRYIQFVDADDCLIPSAYESVIEQVRKVRADIILFHMTTKNRKSALAPCSQVLSPTDFLQHRNLRAAAWGYAFRRDILGELQFYPGLLHEDELFTPQLFMKAHSLCELNVKAYFYRQHEGTITRSNVPEKIKKRLNDTHYVIRQLQLLEEPILERRTRQLTADYLQKTWTLTHSLRELRRRIRELRAEGLLPLPLRRYSMRYLFIASIVNFI